MDSLFGGYSPLEELWANFHLVAVTMRQHQVLVAKPAGEMYHLCKAPLPPPPS